MKPYKISIRRLAAVTKIAIIRTQFSTTKKSRLVIDEIIKLPKPGITKMLSIKTVVPIIVANRLTKIVIKGISAFLS